MASRREQLVLASASPARARLLAAAGLEFAVEPAGLDEAAMKRGLAAAHASAADCALALAAEKARSVSLRRQALVIGADQLLVCGGDWLDKPADLAAARAQLRRLAGETHELVTAVCVAQRGDVSWSHVSRPCLTMRAFDDAFLDAYLAAEGSAVLDCVGAYRLEARGVQLFARIEGDHFAILGLPLLELLGYLRERHAIL
ncbi:MAG TPA: Maf family nucleotide pyrophosphatase [Stellaceae bacterium]|nr:Maf family nucleotide pyrophosphatase [Stellaceae bacterium]